MNSRYIYSATLMFGLILSSLNAADNLTLTGTGDASIFLYSDTDNSGVEDTPYINFWKDASSTLSIIGIVGSDGFSPRSSTACSGTLADSFFAGTSTANALQLATSGVVRLTITNGGNVGIGTNAASSKLHLYDAVEPTFKIESAADGLPTIKFVEANVTKWSVLNNTSDRLVFRSTVSGVSTDQVVLDPAGNVGIGTATPSHKLSVNGAVRAKEIIVDTSWADDVFAPDYRLASLAEVEQHIQAKGHLPAVPSAAEVAEKGISVGESQAMLLRKVEELTLHVIALNKQVQAQQKRLMELESPQAAKP